MASRVLWRLCLAPIALLVAISGCDNQPTAGDLQTIRKRGELLIITRNAPTTYYQHQDELEGLEYDLASAFSRHLNVQPRFIVKENISDILSALKGGEGDIAAAGLTRTNGRMNEFLFGPSYQDVKQQVVCRRNGNIAKDVQQLTGVSLTVPAHSSYVEQLNTLRKSHPTLNWKSTTEADTEQLLERVWQKEIDCTVADSNIVAINRRYFPELTVPFDLSEAEPLAWLLPPQADDLQSAINSWFETFKSSGELDALIARYYDHIDIFDYVDTQVFSRRSKEVLPKYREIFTSAAAAHEIDWTLLAAQAYQESHWKAQAKSPTGVRGIMMLTLPTARELGVKSRLDAKQSILGGAKYLSRIRNRLPAEIVEPDRTWMALAAYNVGYGHLQDARALAKRHHKNPNLWSDVATTLPLLAQKQYYRTVKHGYARGREPVRYVNHIRDYHDMLIRILENGEQNRLASASDSESSGKPSEKPSDKPSDKPKSEPAPAKQTKQ
ncbi:MAG: membrane-bound lytic murein transglycosylase MltF [Gammaproteobacteria bacterium]|nr:membrane-bound lytic murein transglycosylase MltF [Gammaproteobacteria bacterium]